MTFANFDVKDMQPTTLRALLIAVPDPIFRPRTIVDEVSKRLERMFPGSAKDIRTVYTEHDCMGDALREIIDEWVAGAKSTPHLFYFHGHGGRLELAGGLSYYLQCHDDAEGRKTGLLDVELSAWMTTLHDRCGGNLNVIVDSCHSGIQVRQLSDPSSSKTPSWIDRAFARAAEVPLAAHSHPGIVRLMASSPARHAKAVAGMGRFTRQLLSTFDELGDQWHRTSWTMLAHCVRQRLINDTLRESQWVSVAGPGDRLLFSTCEATPTRAVGLVEHDGHAWIRAGKLTGVETGDRWAPLERLVSESGGREFPMLPSAAVVAEPEENRARLEPCNLGQSQLASFAAALERVARPVPVHIVGVPASSFQFENTVWLEPGSDAARHRIVARDGVLELVDCEDRWECVRFDDDADGRTALVDLLEDRARAERLVESATAMRDRSPRRPPLTYEVGVGERVLEWSSSGAPPSVEPGAQLWICVRDHSREPPPDQPRPTWFVAIVLIDAIGRAVLLNSSQVDGIEIGPGEREYVGRRLGAAQRGVVIDWSPEVPAPSQARRLQILFVSSSRPLQLAHLTHAFRESEPSAFHLQGLDAPVMGRGIISVDDGPQFELLRTQAWGFSSFALDLRAAASQAAGTGPCVNS